MGIRRTRDSGRTDTMGRKIRLADNLARETKFQEQRRRAHGAQEVRASRVLSHLSNADRVDDGLRHDVYVLMNDYDAHIAQTHRTLNAIDEFARSVDNGDLTPEELQELGERNRYYQGVLKTAYDERATLARSFDENLVDQGGSAILAEEFKKGPGRQDWTNIIAGYDPNLPEPAAPLTESPAIGTDLAYTVNHGGREIAVNGTVIGTKEDGVYVQWEGSDGDGNAEYPVTGPHAPGEFVGNQNGVSMPKPPLSSPTARRVGTAARPVQRPEPQQEPQRPALIDTPQVYPVQRRPEAQAQPASRPLPHVGSPADERGTVVVDRNRRAGDRPAAPRRAPRTAPITGTTNRPQNDEPRPAPRRAPRQSPQQVDQHRREARQQVQQRRERNGSFRVTKRSNVGPFVVHYSMKGVSSIGFKMGLLTYRLWSRDPNAKRGMTSVDLPGPISYRPNNRSRF